MGQQEVIEALEKKRIYAKEGTFIDTRSLIALLPVSPSATRRSIKVLVKSGDLVGIKVKKSGYTKYLLALNSKPPRSSVSLKKSFYMLSHKK